MFRFVIRPLSWAGIIIFFILIGASAFLYPGGNRFDIQFAHYSFTGNYLCDLFERLAYNGAVNEGRPYAMAGTYILALTLLLFWNLVPALFKNHMAKYQRTVRIFGTLAMLVSLLIATPLHDWCILIAIPLALIAFVVSIFALNKSGERNLARLGSASVAICVINYFSLIFQVFPRMLPGLQKITLVVFLLWVIACLLRLKPAQTSFVR